MSSAQSDEVRDYLRKRLPVRGSHPDDADFFPWKNPDKDYIPYCSSCMGQYESAKSAPVGTKVEWDHSPACIWYDWFVGRLRTVNPRVTVMRKFGSGERCGKATLKKA